jgi:hypothetical protein
VENVEAQDSLLESAKEGKKLSVRASAAIEPKRSTHCDTDTSIKEALASLPAIVQGMKMMQESLQKIGQPSAPYSHPRQDYRPDQGSNQGYRPNPGRGRNMENIQCYGCDAYGHYKRDCPHRPSSNSRPMPSQAGNRQGTPDSSVPPHAYQGNSHLSA